MTGQDLLDRMEIFNAELQNQTSEPDVTRSLTALNMAQDHFEALMAARSKSFGSTTGTLVQTKGVESTPYPTGLLRLDRLQYLHPTTGLPSWDIVRLHRTGAHAPSQFWPYNLIVQAAPGTPRAYFTDGSNIFWDPLPDMANSVRWYGFQAAVNVAIGTTFPYLDMVATPLAGLAARMLKLSLDDDASQISGLAEEFLGPVVTLLSNFDRDRAPEFEYTRLHEA